MNTTALSKTFKRIGILTTLADAGVALARGRPGSAALLVVAAVLSTRVKGLGFAVSLLLRAYHRLR